MFIEPRRMFWRRCPPMLLLALWLSQACEKPLAAVARVNNQPISQATYDVQLQRNLARFYARSSILPPGVAARIRESVLNRMIDDEIIAQKARSLQINVTPQEIDKKMQENKDRFQSPQAFDDYLRRSSNTEAMVRSDLEHNLLRDRVIDKLSGDVQVSDADMQRYYEQNPHLFVEVPAAHVRRIVVKIPPNADGKMKAQKKQRAMQLRQMVMRPKGDFGAVARAYSEAAAEAPQGGDLGFLKGERLPSEFAAQAFKIDLQQISEIYETPYNYTFYQVLERRDGRRTPFKEVESNLRNLLLAQARNEKRRDAFRDLKKTAKIAILMQFDESTAPSPSAAAANTKAAEPNAPASP